MRRPDPLPQRKPDASEQAPPPQTAVPSASKAPKKKAAKSQTKASKPERTVDPRPVDMSSGAEDETVDLSELDADNDANVTEAVVTPLRRLEERESDEDTEPAAEGADKPVGMRDVWRAARAKRHALRREVRRFTVTSRRRRMVWIVSIAAVVALVAGSFAVAYSPLFAVQKITVTGTATLDNAAVVKSLESQVGKPLAAVSDSEIKAALVTFPFVETYSVQAHPPHELVVNIVERTPVGVVKTDAGYSLVDAAGVVLSTTPDPPAGQPVIDVVGGVGSDAFSSAGLVMLSLPASIRPQVTTLTATTPGDITLTLGGSGVQIIWGSEDDSALKATTLEAAMKAAPAGTVSVYDVSSPTAIVMR